MNKIAKQEMAVRVASHKIARMEKQAFFKVKSVLTKVMSFLPRNVQQVLQGADEEQIAKQIKKLKKDKEFMKIVEEAPEGSSIRDLWGYFSFSLRRAYNFGKKALIVAVILGVVLAMLGSVAYLFGGGYLEAFLVGFLFAPMLDLGGDDDAKTTKKRQEENAREIAKNRLLNNR